MGIGFLTALATLFFWGFGNFIAKIASNISGGRAVFWDRIGSLIIVFVLVLIVGEGTRKFSFTWQQAMLGILVGVFTGIGTYLFYQLLSKNSASWTVAITSVYPIVTIIFALIFLHEKLKTREVAGIVLGLISVYLLSGV